MTLIVDVDILIIGAGLSGIGAARHVQSKLPGKTFAILEARGAIGGTWDLFRYPGVRSDSDMHTLGYNFKPWISEKSIADGPAILAYVREAATETGVDEHILFDKKVLEADWSSDEARWTVTFKDGPTGEVGRARCRYLYANCGYYSYDHAYVPDFPGRERFQGSFVVPQSWPEGLDYTGKRVVIIGSGATAVTLLPAMTDKAAHVTMLQRTPTYIATLPARDRLANFLRGKVGHELAYAITRWKNVTLQTVVFQLSRRRPQMMRRFFIGMAKKQLPDGYDMKNFRPPYNPWDQRLCAVPDGDLFEAIRRGDASVVTDRIATFTEHGIQLESGRELAADIIVSATGLDLVPLGNIRISKDGVPVEARDTLIYKGLLVSDVPNLIFTLGYTNASWTLKADLVAEFFCRAVKHMDRNGHNVFIAHNDDPDVEPVPALDFPSGYVLRAIDKFPKAGSKKPWRLGMM
ncbi:MAG: flavin-containing monooxygenase, partial [Polyangiaceae bacterium]